MLRRSLVLLVPLAALACEPVDEVDNPRLFTVQAEDATRGDVYRDTAARFTCAEWVDGEVDEERWDDRCALYVLSTSDGLELRFPGREALSSGRRLHSEDGDLLVKRGKARGAGWVSLSRTRTVNGVGGYFLDVAGGFDITVDGRHLRRGVFYSRRGSHE